MDVLIIMILSSIFLGAIFLIIFLISLYYGQFDNYESHKIRILIDNHKKNNNSI
ncbi:cbb3-type cytochrome oxidase assembly protein CcoS [Blattabacterium punctulatus]|uniref:cbb3-type cytochrome oxidase assembly protein CcoS n=1 Tax=Blattabacterium punctulatus TaxID=164514 RepID=UPI000D7C3CA0|nr:cbb3-type cytochrome oxidase assembly protein CcoS [Blattabacterium punctulatus]AWU44377.1 cbb3-type cytochrome oxidase assembly protein CcoS [Blattabacterium punctulatus]AWU45461.1 cbb3-type cytochrome oxidase assembly protein CcoS [Blattabacterium punctulatus]